MKFSLLYNYLEKDICEKSLYEFTKAAWHIVEPGTEYKDGWHIRLICDHLQACLAGDIKRLIINIPPRHMKSIICGVMFPAWVWTHRPNFRWLFASYAGSLSVRDSLKCRRLITSNWYKSKWGELFKLTGDQNLKSFFENDKTGYRFATSVGAATTGHGGDAILVDDPQNALQSSSCKMRDSTIEWWDQAMSTRLNNQQQGFKVIIMQRLHQDDLTGHLLKQGGWEHLCLPAEFEESRKSATKIGGDHRKNDGELLWPSHFGKKELQELKLSLGEYGTAGQLQQRPAPAEGGIVKKNWFKLLNLKENQPFIQFIIQSWDTAYTEKTANDPSACVTLGVFATKKGKRVLLLDAWAKHLSYPDLRQKAWDEVSAEYNGKQKKQVDVILIEDKGSGIALARDLRIGLVPVKTYNPGRADKITRMHIISPLIEAGMLYLPESEISSGNYQSFCKDFVHQLTTFPNADHDDIVDATTQALIYLRDANLISIDDYKTVDYQAEQKEHVNPYME